MVFGPPSSSLTCCTCFSVLSCHCIVFLYLHASLLLLQWGKVHSESPVAFGTCCPLEASWPPCFILPNFLIVICISQYVCNSTYYLIYNNICNNFINLSCPVYCYCCSYLIKPNITYLCCHSFGETDSNDVVI